MASFCHDEYGSDIYRELVIQLLIPDALNNGKYLAVVDYQASLDDELFGIKIERALRNIYERNFQPMTDIERNLFHEFYRTFNRATDIGLSQAPNPDDDFLQALRHNNAVFAAFKTHSLQNNVARQLTDSNGNLKSFEQWRNDVRSITSHQCNRWLRTEYDTTIHPNSRWLTNSSSRERLTCCQTSGGCRQHHLIREQTTCPSVTQYCP